MKKHKVVLRRLTKNGETLAGYAKSRLLMADRRFGRSTEFLLWMLSRQRTLHLPINMFFQYKRGKHPHDQWYTMVKIIYTKQLALYFILSKLRTQT